MTKKDRLTDAEFLLLRRYSEKDLEFSVGGNTRSQEPCEDITSLMEGRVTSSSGYLVVCDSLDVEVFRDRTYVGRQGVPSVIKNGGAFGINFNSSDWHLPKMMQVDDFVVFRNLWGDGLFGVLSNSSGPYIETHAPALPNEEFIRDMESGKRIKEEHDGKESIFEGFVGIGSGTAAIVDPVVHKVSYNDKGKSVSTTLKVEPGTYVCKFIDNNKKMSISRAR